MKNNTLSITIRLPQSSDTTKVRFNFEALIHSKIHCLSKPKDTSFFITTCDVTLQNRSRLTGSNELLLVCLLGIPAWKILSKLTDSILDEVGSWLGKLLVDFLKGYRSNTKSHKSDSNISAKFNIVLGGKNINVVNVHFLDINRNIVKIDFGNIIMAIEALDRMFTEEYDVFLDGDAVNIIYAPMSDGGIITLVKDVNDPVTIRKGFVGHMWLDID